MLTGGPLFGGRSLPVLAPDGTEAGELSPCVAPCEGRVAAEDPTGVAQKEETIQLANSAQSCEGYSARSDVAKEPSF